MTRASALALLLLTACAADVFHHGNSGDLAEHVAWREVYAVGPLTSATGEPIDPLVVRIAWEPFAGTVIDGYEVFRAEAAGGQDFTSPVNASLVTTTSFTDVTAESGRTYYYVVRPRSDGALLAVSGTARELRVVVPPVNQALVHRWMANREVCGLMAAPTDPAANYRCAFAGPGARGSFFDLGHDLLIDVFETGCNITATGVTSSLTAPQGNCSYQGVTPNDATASQLAVMLSNAARLPPVAQVSQVSGDRVCRSRLMRLPRLVEWRAASAWADDADVAELEGEDLQGTCNTTGAHGLPASDPDRQNVFLSMVRTGSAATARCVSRYGVRDMIGNVEEMVSDQVDCDTSTCVGRASALDAGNTDLLGHPFGTADGSPMTGGIVGAMAAYPFFSVPLGLPLASRARDDRAVDAGWPHFAADSFRPQTFTNAVGTVLVGGPEGAGDDAGRWYSSMNTTSSNVYFTHGIRCVAPLE